MNSMTKMIVSLAIAMGALSAHAGNDLREERIAKMQTQLEKVQSELSQINASLAAGPRVEMDGKQLVVISATLASIARSVADSIEKGQTSQLTQLKALAAGLRTFTLAEGVIFGLDAGSLLYLQNVRSAEVARLQSNIVELQSLSK